ncbi:MAG: GNAT family N-acetyltransferase, partial [Burkholderiales bacterium]|nr:GNAT family N-acetyltransferase [Burkholderiales bacterium]
RAIALFVLVEHGDGAEVHFCFRPEVWGRTVAAGKAFVEWVWRETEIERLIGPVPTHNRMALALARAVGFQDWMRQIRCVTKNGKTYDRLLLLITRPTT